MNGRKNSRIPTWFRWLQRDAKLTMQEVDKATNEKLDMDMIMEIHLEVGKMIECIEERIKDITRKTKLIYGQLLNELEKKTLLIM